jgi:methyl-accepting chemotaxis protein
MWQIIVIAIIIMCAFLPITFSITKRITGPLRELNNAALEIASGNLDVKLESHSDDEIGTLTESFKKTASQLKLRIEYINSLAYIDKLTGIKNTTAYLNAVTVLKEEIEHNKAVFSLTVVDVNGLKHINDTYGHSYGNMLIESAASILSEAFGEENVYRTGGDEFTAIMCGTGYNSALQLEKNFNDLLNNQVGDIYVSAASGTSTYNSSTDKCFNDVYRRADELMYRKKTLMKENGECSKVNKHSNLQNEAHHS